MNKFVGTTSRGLIAPIINEGDDIALIASETLLNAAKNEGFKINDKDILSVTESVVARSQGNYASADDIAKDIKEKFGSYPIGLIFPILSRNRFSVCLEGIARSKNKLIMMLSYPSDEVGNHLIDPDVFEDSDVNPWTNTFTHDEFRKQFGDHKHKFTGIDYIEYYESIMKKHNPDSFVILSNDPKKIIEHTKFCLTCDIHTRNRTKKLLKKAGAETVLGLDDILNKPVNGSGFNAEYGLLGSNKAGDDKIKLFPNNAQPIVERIQSIIKEKTGKTIEVMVYGDGAFKDPIGKIWELADPVVSPAYTKGLDGKPNEVKLKYLADNNFKGLSVEEQQKQIANYIEKHQKEASSKIDSMESQGTTPRRLIDLIGSLSDLTSGSGDKGTPIIFIQGYFDKYTG